MTGSNTEQGPGKDGYEPTKGFFSQMWRLKQ